MTERGSDDLRDDAALERALGNQPAPEADGEFRRRLREAFVSGEIDEPVDAGPAPRSSRRLLILVGATAAVLVVAAAVQWNVVVDGRGIPATDLEGLRASIATGAEVIVPETAELTLVVPGVALFELVGGTRMTLPSAVGRWLPLRARGRLHAGEVRFLSGPGFEGRELTIATPQGIAIATGTLLSVQCDEGGTCVCVLEGTVRVGVDPADLETIPPGSRKVMLATGEVKIVPAAPPHRDGIRGLEERARGRFSR
jgi:ferric-dicitrate binding protein FerR (iron transport regulator)